VVTTVSVEFQDVAKTYRYRRVFAGVTAAVREGETLVVAGPNGSGKSTLLRLAAGLIRPTRGMVRITVGGAVLERRLLRFHLGLVAPDVALYEELTALENLHFFAAVRGLRLDQAVLQERLQELGLGGRAQDLVGHFSSGLKQRLKFAFALLHEPEILLLDEPGANLDEAGRELVRAVIAAQRTRGVTILATNDPQEVTYGDQIVQLGA